MGVKRLLSPSHAERLAQAKTAQEAKRISQLEKHATRQRRYKAGRTPEQIQRECDRHREKLYGITREALNQRILDQAGKCAACTNLLTPGRGTHIDHDHATGRVRGLLCLQCNVALGHVQDSPERLQALIDYLARYA